MSQPDGSLLMSHVYSSCFQNRSISPAFHSFHNCYVCMDLHVKLAAGLLRTFQLLFSCVASSLGLTAERLRSSSQELVRASEAPHLFASQQLLSSLHTDCQQLGPSIVKLNSTHLTASFD